MFVSSPNFYVAALIPDVIAFGDGSSGKYLGLDEVRRVEPGPVGSLPL